MTSALDRYISAWVVAAVVAGGVLGFTTGAPGPDLQVLFLAAAIAVAERVTISIPFERAIASLTLIEAGIAAAILLVPPAHALLAAAGGAALAQLLRRETSQRAVFNVAQIVVATAVAAGLLSVVPTYGPTVEGRSVTVAMAGMVLYGVVSISAVLGVLHVLGERSSPRWLGSQTVVSFGTSLGSAAVGIVFAVLWDQTPTIAPLLLVPAAAVYLASRGALRSAELLREVRVDRDRLTRVVDGASDGIMLLDGQGSVQVWNPAMERMTGITAGEAVQRPVSELLTRRVRVADDEVTGRWLIDRAHEPMPGRQLTARLHHVDGTVRVVRESHGLVFDERGRCTGDVVLVRDVSRQEELERLRSDFVARVSHELRTPLTPIRGFASVLLRRSEQLSEPQRREALENILDRADHLGEIVEDLLLVTRVDQGEARELVDVRPIDLGLVIAPLVQRTATRHPARAITFHQAPQTCAALADPARVRQIIEALLDNACRYSPPGTPIEVELDRDGDDVRVRIIDHGTGIPRDQREAIFERFHRLEDPMTMRTSGVGLGLFLARQLATAMHGRVELEEPQTNTGAIFVLRLPATEPVGQAVNDAV